VAARLSEWLAGDLPAAMRRELAPHVDACGRCRGEIEFYSTLFAELRALPVSASPARSWASIEAAVAAERRLAPVPWLVQALALAACGLLVATALVRQSPGFASLFSAPAAIAPWLLPGLFALVGAILALSALPLLEAAGRAVAVPAGRPGRVLIDAPIR
jgi:hypothetical protein